MKLTKRKLKLLVKEGLTRGLSSLQLNEFEMGAEKGEATATDPAGGEQKISGDNTNDDEDIFSKLQGALADWTSPENADPVKYKAAIQAIVDAELANRNKTV